LEVKAFLTGFMVLLLGLPAVLPLPAEAEGTASYTAEGRVGKVSAKERKIEINGRLYYLPSRMVIKNEVGERLAFRHIRPGNKVRMTGRMVTVEGRAMVKYTELVILQSY
jgi:hypothetical protein